MESSSLILPAKILLCSAKASPPRRLPPQLTVLDLTHILEVAMQAISTSLLSSSGHKSKSIGCDCSTQEPARLGKQDGQPATPRSAHGHLEPRVFRSAQGSSPAQISLGFFEAGEGEYLERGSELEFRPGKHTRKVDWSLGERPSQPCCSTSVTLTLQLPTVNPSPVLP